MVYPQCLANATLDKTHISASKISIDEPIYFMVMVYAVFNYLIEFFYVIFQNILLVLCGIILLDYISNKIINFSKNKHILCKYFLKFICILVDCTSSTLNTIAVFNHNSYIILRICSFFLLYGMFSYATYRYLNLLVMKNKKLQNYIFYFVKYFPLYSGFSTLLKGGKFSDISYPVLYFTFFFDFIIFIVSFFIPELVFKIFIIIFATEWTKMAI